MQLKGIIRLISQISRVSQVSQKYVFADGVLPALGESLPGGGGLPDMRAGGGNHQALDCG